MAQASANTATLLNACGVDLTQKPWAGVQLAGADLGNSSLAGADLTAANLQGAQLNPRLLSQANLKSANLCHVSWVKAPISQTDQPLSLNGPQLLGTQMSAESRNLLAQHGADVSRVEEIKKTPAQSSPQPSAALSAQLPTHIPGFIGRTELLNTLAQQFNAPTVGSAVEETKTDRPLPPQPAHPRNVVLCTGLGGMGKNRLALKCVHTAAKSYTHKFWFIADTPQT